MDNVVEDSWLARALAMLRGERRERDNGDTQCSCEIEEHCTCNGPSTCERLQAALGHGCDHCAA